MVSVNDVVVSFGGFDLLDQIRFMINPRDRIGLVGKNGAGKSTLMKIMAGIQKPTSGSISVPSDVNVGYLPQIMQVSDSTSLMQETLKAFARVQELEQQLERLNAALIERDDYESDSYAKLIQQLADANEHYHLLGGDNREGEAEKTLLGLGFKRTDFERPTNEFSGGWRMRIELAKILLLKPELLLLDEPTNHLDIESIEWLEEYLQSYPGALVLISHDRAFLDNITNRTIEILLSKVYDYDASYSKYVQLRQERREQQLATYRNQQKMIEKTEDFIERFRYKASKSNQVQSRIKQLDKLDRVEVDEEDLSRLNMRFPSAPRSGNVVFMAKDLAKKYGNHTVFEQAQMEVERGQKVALVGRNGEGKSTLLKILMGQLEATRGEAHLGHQVKIGYFAQNQDDLLNPDESVFDTLDRVAVGDVRTRMRDILGAFLFRGEDVDKKVKVLSGGERSRLAMARLMLEPYNLLVLDEPTNHLDMRSKDILKQALSKYDGTVIVVSHDREFLDGLVSKIYEFRDGRVKEHLGGIYDFLKRRKLEHLNEVERKSVSEKPQASMENPSKGEEHAGAASKAGGVSNAEAGLKGKSAVKGNRDTKGSNGFKAEGVSKAESSSKTERASRSETNSTLDSASKEASVSHQKKAAPGPMSFLQKKEYDKQLKKLRSVVDKLELEIESIDAELEQMNDLLSHQPASANETFFARYNELKKRQEDAFWQWEKAHQAVEVYLKGNE